MRLQSLHRLDLRELRTSVSLGEEWAASCSGNIKQIITQENGSDVYTSTRLVYARNG